MKLVNYDLESPNVTTTIVSDGVNFDLHNDWDFEGLQFMPSGDYLILEFSRVKATQPARICLKFHGIDFFNWSRDAGDSVEPDCVLDISKAIPNESKFPNKDKWAKGDKFDLIFGMGTGTLRVGCKESILEIG